jgi:hypothetical protein
MDLNNVSYESFDGEFDSINLKKCSSKTCNKNMLIDFDDSISTFRNGDYKKTGRWTTEEVFKKTKFRMKG